MTVVQKRWPNGVIACLASGPSLTQEDCDLVRGKVDGVIAVNDAVRLAPWADILYSSDPRFWKRFHRQGESFAGQKFAIETNRKNKRDNYPWPDIAVLRNTGIDGLETHPSSLKTYWNSGGAAINLAVHFGAAKILLLGYDMSIGPNGKKHFHNEACGGSPYTDFRKHIATMVDPLKAIGVTVINCSRQTRLSCFPRKSLTEALAVAA